MSDDKLPSVLDVQPLASVPTMTSDLSSLSSEFLGSSISVLPYSPVELNAVKNTSSSPVMDSWREQWWSTIHCEQHKETHTQEDPEVRELMDTVGTKDKVHWEYRMLV